MAWDNIKLFKLLNDDNINYLHAKLWEKTMISLYILSENNCTWYSRNLIWLNSNYGIIFLEHAYNKYIYFVLISNARKLTFLIVKYILLENIIQKYFLSKALRKVSKEWFYSGNKIKSLHNEHSYDIRIGMRYVILTWDAVWGSW